MNLRDWRKPAFAPAGRHAGGPLWVTCGRRLFGNSQFNTYLPTLGDAFIASRGGNPIVVNGKIIGAIGDPCGTGAQDDTISQAGAAAVK